MITCELFRARFTPGTDDVEVLEHLRSCETCFAFAVQADGDMLFRGIGGGEMIPPGGVDAFVGDVMREVHLRSTEKVAAHRKFGWARRLAVAATLAAAIAGTLYYPRQQSVVPVQRATIVQPMTRPVIEKYDSDTATIVEMPTEGAEDVKVVMIFDEKLPADL
jgi:hypothetical protein